MKNLPVNFFKGCTSKQFFTLGEIPLNLGEDMLSDVVASESELLLFSYSRTPKTIFGQVFPYIAWSTIQQSGQRFIDEVNFDHVTIKGPLCNEQMPLTAHGYKIFSLNHTGLNEFPKCLKMGKITDELDLSSNQIKLIPGNSMTGLEAQNLNLMDNPIETIEKQVFRGLSQLKLLSISLTKNTDPASFYFSDSHQLQKIVLSVPEDFRLDPEIFTRMDHPLTLEVHGGQLADSSVRKKLAAFNIFSNSLKK